MNTRNSLLCFCSWRGNHSHLFDIHQYLQVTSQTIEIRANGTQGTGALFIHPHQQTLKHTLTHKHCTRCLSLTPKKFNREVLCSLPLSGHYIFIQTRNISSEGWVCLEKLPRRNLRCKTVEFLYRMFLLLWPYHFRVHLEDKWPLQKIPQQNV